MATTVVTNNNMEFWLKCDSTNEAFQFPVNPPEFELQTTGNNGSIKIESFGELTFLGPKNLSTISLSSSFPAKVYNYCFCVPEKDPYIYVDKINSWWEQKIPIRLIIVGTPINMLCSIENFTHKEVAMCRDVDFTLELKEYKIITPTILKTTNTSNDNSLIKEVQHDLQRLSCLKSGEANATGKLDDATKAGIKQFKYIVDLTVGKDIDSYLTTALNAIVKKPTIGYGWTANVYATKFIQWWLGITPKDGIFSTSMRDKVKVWQLKNKIWGNPDGVIREKDWNIILK
jgi:hypothetical protein